MDESTKILEEYPLLDNLPDESVVFSGENTEPSSKELAKLSSLLEESEIYVEESVEQPLQLGSTEQTFSLTCIEH